MFSPLQLALCCAFLVTVSARPQVWNIGTIPNGAQRQNPFLPNPSASESLPQVELSTTTAAPVQVTTPSRAFYDCLSRCPTTSEYNPICGSNSVNYHNLGSLQCATRCGANVTAVRSGTCAGL